MHAVTIAPARALKIDDRVGSLKVGKDADLVLKRGALLDVTAPVDMVIIDGNIVFEREDSGIVVRAAAGEGGAPAPQDAQGYAPETGTEVRAAANGHAGGSARREVKS